MERVLRAAWGLRHPLRHDGLHYRVLDYPLPLRWHDRNAARWRRLADRGNGVRIPLGARVRRGARRGHAGGPAGAAHRVFGGPRIHVEAFRKLIDLPTFRPSPSQPSKHSVTITIINRGDRKTRIRQVRFNFYDGWWRYLRYRPSVARAIPRKPLSPQRPPSELEPGTMLALQEKLPDTLEGSGSIGAIEVLASHRDLPSRVRVSVGSIAA